MFENVREDWQVHDCNWTRHGFWALVVYRFGRWRYGIQSRWLRMPFSFGYKLLKFGADSLLGIEIPCETVIGRRFTIEHTGAIVISGDAVFGDDCIVRNGVKIDMVSPIEGSVSDINEAAINNPALASSDCHGEGWLVKVQSPDAKTNFRNLLTGALARWWTEESSMRLQRLVPSALGALAQDGGVAIDDVAGTLPDEQWAKVTREFFLT